MMQVSEDGRRVITSHGRIVLPKGYRAIVAEDRPGDDGEPETRIYPVRYRFGERLLDRLEDPFRRWVWPWLTRRRR